MGTAKPPCDGPSCQISVMDRHHSPYRLNPRVVVRPCVVWVRRLYLFVPDTVVWGYSDRQPSWSEKFLDSTCYQEYMIFGFIDVDYFFLNLELQLTNLVLRGRCTFGYLSFITCCFWGGVITCDTSFNVALALGESLSTTSRMSEMVIVCLSIWPFSTRYVEYSCRTTVNLTCFPLNPNSYLQLATYPACHSL